MCGENDTLHHSSGWVECLDCFYEGVITEFKAEDRGNYWAYDEPFDDGV